MNVNQVQIHVAASCTKCGANKQFLAKKARSVMAQRAVAGAIRWAKAHRCGPVMLGVKKEVANVLS